MFIKKYGLSIGRFIIFWLIGYMSVRSSGVSFLLAIAMYLTWYLMRDRVPFSLKAKRKLNRERREIRLNNEQDLFFEEQRRWNEKMNARERASNQTRSGE